MPRKSDGRQARTITVHVRFTPDGVAALDLARGPQGRSEYVRDLVARDVQAKQRGTQR
jgi:hypothetical protein